MKRRIFFHIALTGLGAILFHEAAHGCAVCITGAAGERLTDAFNWSVLFLMAMPYTILVSVAGFFFYNYRRAAKKDRGDAGGTRAFPLAWIHKESGR